MILQALFFFTFLNNNIADTLLLPIFKGAVKDNSIDHFGLHDASEVVIYPTKCFEVKSCSSGKVTAIRKQPDQRYAIIIKSDSLFFTYIIDTVAVTKEERIEKAQVIGKLKNVALNKTANGKNPLIFFVSKKETLLDSYKFLVYDY